jgi:chromosome segregation ATPase
MPEQRVGLAYEVESKEAEKRMASITKRLEENKKALHEVKEAIVIIRTEYGKMNEIRREAIKGLQQEKFALEETGRILQEQARQQQAATRETEQAARTRGQAEAAAARETVRAEERKRREYERTRKALALNVKKLIFWGLGARTAFRIFSRLRIALRDFVKDVIKGTDEQEQMTAAGKELRAALAGAFGPEIMRAVSALATGVENLAKWMTYLAVQTEINRRVQAAAAQATDTHAQMLLAQGVSAEAVVKTHDSLNESLLDEESALAAVTARMDEFKSKVDESVPSMKAAVNAIRKSSQALRDYRQDLEDIRREWQVADLRAGGDFFRESEKINRELQEAITEINEKALANRERALAQANKRMQRQQQQANRNLEKLEAQHELQMEYNRRRYELTQIQNERMYQYQRGLLVAEGDVLAIEDFRQRQCFNYNCGSRGRRRENRRRY